MGYVLSEFVFGKSSRSGYYRRGGRYRTKNRSVGLKLLKIVATGAVAFMLTTPVGGLGPVAAIGLALVLVFLYPHLDIGHWKSRQIYDQQVDLGTFPRRWGCLQRKSDGL